MRTHDDCSAKQDHYPVNKKGPHRSGAVLFYPENKKQPEKLP